MKKLWLLTLLIGTAFKMKAQQTNTIKPFEAPLYDLPLNNKINNHYTDSLTQSILKPLQSQTPLKHLESIALITGKNVVSQDFYTTMPVAKLNSDDPMPVAGRNIPLTDPMPTKRINIIKANTNSSLSQTLLDYKKPVNSK